MQALPSIFMSMALYVTGKNSMTLCVTASMTLYIIAKFCMTLCITSLISLKIGCMTQKYRPKGRPGSRAKKFPRYTSKVRPKECLNARANRRKLTQMSDFLPATVKSWFDSLGGGGDHLQTSVPNHPILGTLHNVEPIIPWYLSDLGTSHTQ